MAPPGLQKALPPLGRQPLPPRDSNRKAMMKAKPTANASDYALQVPGLSELLRPDSSRSQLHEVSSSRRVEEVMTDRSSSPNENGRPSSSQSSETLDSSEENTRLREEIRRLQESLVQKYRGSGKIVGGSQFRVGKAQVATKTCSSCPNMKNTMKKLRHDHKELQQYTNDIQFKLSEALTEKQRLSEVNIENESQLSQLQKIISNQKERLALFDEHSSGVEKVSELQNELHSLRKQSDKIQQLEAELKESTLRINFLQTEKQRDAGLLTQHKMRQESQLAELGEIQEALDAALSELDTVKGQYNELQSRMTGETLSHKKQIETLMTEKATALNDNATLKAKSVSLEASVVKINDELLCAKDELEILKREAKSLKLSRRKSMNDIDSLTEQQDKARRSEQELLSAKSLIEANLREAQQKLALRNTDISALQLDNRNINQELIGLKEERSRLQKEIFELQKKLEGQHSSASNDVQAEREQQNLLREESAELKKRLHELERSLKLATDDYEAARLLAERTKSSQDEAIEKAMQSLVRLCVVAPTVNVQLGDEEKSITCKANMPKEKIKTIVENTILPVFSKLFVQPSEGLSPDGTKLDDWLQNLLAEMQNSIEKHLKNVFQS